MSGLFPRGFQHARNRRAPGANLSDLILANDLVQVDDLDPEARREAVVDRSSPVVLLITVLATLGVLAYGVFLLNPANRGDLLPWLLVITAEAVLVFHALMAMWTMLVGYGRTPRFAVLDASKNLYEPRRNERLGLTDRPTEWPLHVNGQIVSVDVLITVYGEPLDVIRRTVTAAMAIRGAHDTYLLDDGDSDAVRDLAAALGCGYIRRLGNAGAKAGNINNALTVAKGEYFVVLDADFVAEPEFLEETLPHMTDPNLAFVQTPQTYGNLHNIISRGAGFMQTMFYRFVQPGRNAFNAAFCVGTNVLFRRAAIEDIGGMYTQSKSEDVWTSLILHERGWRSVFVPTRLATGDAPDTVEAFSKQQLRWATGGFEILLHHNPLGRRRNLTADQRMMYLVTASHYLTGIAPGLLLFVPALEVFFDLRPVALAVGPLEWMMFYSGFYLLQVVLAAVIAGTFRWEVLLLSANSFPIYLRAFRNAWLEIDQKWSVTGTTGGRTSAFNFIIPQVLTFVFLLLTSVVALWRDWMMQQFNVATFWNLVNTVAMGTFLAVARHEDRTTRPSATRGFDAQPIEVYSREDETPVERTPVLTRDSITEARQDIERLAVGSGRGTTERNEDLS